MLDFLFSLPVNLSLINSIKKLMVRGAHVEVISGGYLPIVKAMCDYYFGDVTVVAQTYDGAAIKGRKHNFATYPTNQSCLVTDNSEDILCCSWKKIIYYEIANYKVNQ